MQQMSGPAGVLFHVKAPQSLLAPPADDAKAIEIRESVISRAIELQGTPASLA
jgi:hypothetical protein